MDKTTIQIIIITVISVIILSVIVIVIGYLSDKYPITFARTTSVLKKLGISLIVALFGGVFFHSCFKGVFYYNELEICIKELKESGIFWEAILYTWFVFWVGWFVKFIFYESEKR